MRIPVQTIVNKAATEGSHPAKAPITAANEKVSPIDLR
jgi:hypothetical protein